MRKGYNAVANSHNDDSLTLGITLGRKREGVAILWNNKYDEFIIPHKYDWVVSIEIVSGTKKMYIFNVYLPYDKKIMRKNIFTV